MKRSLLATRKNPMPTAITQPNPWQVEPFIDKPVISDRTGLSIRSVENLMASDTIRFYRVGRRVKFLWSEVLADLQKNCRV
jgi:hypothetical protein